MGYFSDVTAQPEYDIQFWNAARGKRGSEDVLEKGRKLRHINPAIVS